MTDYSDLIARLRRIATTYVSPGSAVREAMEDAAAALSAQAEAIKGLEGDAARMREVVEDAADEWSEYIVEDRAPRSLTKHMLRAWDAAIARA